MRNKKENSVENVAGMYGALWELSKPQEKEGEGGMEGERKKERGREREGGGKREGDGEREREGEGESGREGKSGRQGEGEGERRRRGEGERGEGRVFLFPDQHLSRHKPPVSYSWLHLECYLRGTVLQISWVVSASEE